MKNGWQRRPWYGSLLPAAAAPALLKTEILHGIDMSIECGEVYGLIGQNGAGKTTLLRLISGLMKPTKGTVNLQTSKPFLGYMPQSCRFDDNATVSDTIRFFARLRNADTKESVALGKKLNLDMSKKVKHLSPGQQKKLQMIIAMTGEPDLYVLDEPTAGLDPNATFEMKGIIRGIHEKRKSIIISSHILQDMDEICTNIAIMQNGQLTYNNEIETYYIFKIAKISRQVIEMLSSDFSLSVNELGTTLTAKITKEQVPLLISALTSHDVTPYISVQRAWRAEHNRPVISTVLKTKAAKRDIPIPKCLVDCLREAKEKSISDYVIADSEGQPLSYSQFKRVWQYVVVRSTKERTYYKYVNGESIRYTVKPTLGTHQKNNPKIVYSMDFEVTPHQLRHTYITNLLYSGVDPKTVQYLAGHENSKTTMDIYAKIKYNKPEELLSVVNAAFQ